MNNNSIKRTKLERINNLSNQINNISHKTIHNSNNKINETEEKIKGLENIFINYVEQENKKYMLLEEELDKMNNDYLNQINIKEVNFNSKMKKLDELNIKLKNLFDKMKSNKEYSENKITNIIDESFDNLKKEIKYENISRNKNILDYTVNLDEKLTKIENQILEEKSKKEDCDFELTNKITNDKKNFIDIIEYEKLNTQNSIKSVDELIKEIFKKVKIDINNEKKERENNEDYILSLLEKTYSKINEINS